MHGEKKWIRDYRGKVKRSNNRTKLDFYAGLKAWDSRTKGGEFCPQCKHVRKAVQNNLEEYREAEVKVRGEWKALYGDCFWARVDKKTIYFVDYFRRHNEYPGKPWCYNPRNYFCFKHERMYEQERGMWDTHINGEKVYYRWAVKHERQKYRREVKHTLQRAKYDDDVYDEIAPKRRDWLD